MLETKSSDIGKSRAIDISCIHFRDADSFDPFRVGFKMEEVMTDEGPQDAPVIFDRIDKPAAQPQRKKEDRDHAMMIEVYAHDLGGNATSTQWQGAMEEEHGWSRSKFMRNLKEVKDRGRITGGGEQGDCYQVVPKALERAGVGEAVSSQTGVMVTPYKGGDTSDTGFEKSQVVSNECHDTGDTGSGESRNDHNPVGYDEQSDAERKAAAANDLDQVLDEGAKSVLGRKG